jgi:hypothetical protein
LHRLAIATITALLALPANADSGMWGSRGISHRFLTRDNLVFDADGRGLAVYDVSSPAAVKRTTVAQTDDESLDAAFIGVSELAVLTRGGINRYLFSPDGGLSLESTLPVAGGYTMLASNGRLLAARSASDVTIWVTTPGGMNFSASIVVNGRVNAMVFHGDRLYLAVDGQGVSAYDVAGNGPLSFLPLNAQSIAVQADLLYVSAGINGLVIVSVADDLAPVVVSRTGAGEVDLKSVAVVGTRVYAAEGSDVVHVYDATSVAQPRLAATIHEPVQAMAAAGTDLYLSGSIIDLYGLANETGLPLRVYDVRDPGAPRVSGDFRDRAGPVSGVATDGTLAYVVDPPYFRVIDVSSPESARELSSIQIENIQDHVKVDGQRAVVYGRGDVDLIDIADPYRPRLLGIFHSYGRPPSNAAFAGAGRTVIEGNPWSGFHVIDFDTYGPSQPVQIAGIKGHYKEIVGRGSSAYLFGDPLGMRVVDLSTRGSAVVVDDLTTNAVQAEVAPATDAHSELLVVGLPDGIRVFSLANPLKPVEIRLTPLPHAVPFATIGDMTYLGTDDTMTAMDLVSGGMTATAWKVSAPMQIATGPGGRIVVADRYSLRIFGPKTPTPPPPPAVRRRALQP